MKTDSLTESSRKAIRFILDTLEANLSDKFTYHTVGHTRSVITQVEKLARSEGADQISIELLRVAAAWHDCGFLNNIVHHEEESCLMVNRHLPSFGFNKEQVDDICNIIRATKIPHNPNYPLQEIICDADLYYLGTDDYEEFAGLLYRELKHFGVIGSNEDWLDKQIRFLSNHRYFTLTAKNLYEAKLNFNLERLIEIRNSIKRTDV